MSRYCMKCGKEVLVGNKFCAHCGTPVPVFKTAESQPQHSAARICRACGAVIPDRNNFCTKCGKPVSNPATMPVQNIICTSCGAKVAVNNTFCKACGKPTQVNEPAEMPNHQMKTCRACGAPLSADNKFCMKCGTQQSALVQDVRCSSCGAQGAVDNKFCKVCGKPQQAQSAAPSVHAYHQPAVTYFQNQIPVVQKKKKRRKIWIPITAAATALAVFLIVLFGPFRGSMPQGSVLGNTELQTYMPDEVVLTEKEVVAEGTMYPDGSTIGTAEGTVAMAFDALCINAPAEAKIVQLEVENSPDGSILNVYDFSIDSDEELAGVVTIAVPYDPAKIPAGQSATECVSGVYYDEELHEWIEETYSIDESHNTVIIKTTHLSPHGTRIAWNDEENRLLDLFITVCIGTPDEYVVPLSTDSALGKLTQEDMVELIEELKKNGAADPQQALNDASLKIVGDTGSFSAIGVETFKLTSYAGKWSEFLGDRLGELSGALVLAQLASDVYYEKPQAEMYFNLLKGLTYWKGAALAGYLGGPVGATIATVVLAGMFLYEFFVEPIDIPQYIEESNHQVIVDAYYMYYHSGENYRTKNEWLQEINALVKEAYEEDKTGGNFDDIFKELLDEEITAYATEFFNEKSSLIRQYVSTSFDNLQGYLGSYDRVYSETDSQRNTEYVAEYVTEILSGKYEGVSTSLQDELINGLKQEIYKDTIPKIMDMRKEYQYLQQLEHLRQTQQKLCQYFNTQFSLIISDSGCKDGEDSKYSGFYVAPKIVELDPEYKLEKWIVQLNKDGKGQLDYTLIAHQMAGDFTQLCLYNKDDYDKILIGTAEPVMVLEIGTITSNEHYIVFGEVAADITITGESSTTYEVAAGENFTHTFEAVSSYNGECYIVWDFGDGSDEVKTAGNESSTSHEYETQGKFTVTAKLYDNNDKQLAEDAVTIELTGISEPSAGQESDVFTGVWYTNHYNQATGDVDGYEIWNFSGGNLTRMLNLDSGDTYDYAYTYILGDGVDLNSDDIWGYIMFEGSDTPVYWFEFSIYSDGEQHLEVSDNNYSIYLTRSEQ